MAMKMEADRSELFMGFHGPSRGLIFKCFVVYLLCSFAPSSRDVLGLFCVLLRRGRRWRSVYLDLASCLAEVRSLLYAGYEAGVDKSMCCH